MRTWHKALGLAAALAASLAAAEAPTGEFKAKGTNAGDGSPYEGTVSVVKTGETYKVIWKLGEVLYQGTGLDQGRAFAVAYMTPDRSWFGVAVYEKGKDGKWKGSWAAADGTKKGTETWSR